MQVLRDLSRVVAHSRCNIPAAPRGHLCVPQSPSAGLFTQSSPSHPTGELILNLIIVIKIMCGAVFLVRPSGDSCTENLSVFISCFDDLCLMLRATMLWLLMTVTEPFNSSKLHSRYRLAVIKSSIAYMYV